MGKKRPKEQIAYHSYKQQVSISRSGNDASREEVGSATATAEPLRKRVVTLHDEVQADITWKEMADRRQQVRRASAKPPANTPLVPRTLAQTGAPASAGQMRTIRRGSRKSLPIPARASGQRSKRRWGFLQRVLAFFGILVIGVLGLSFALTSPAFRVQQVNVVGTDNRALVKTIQHMGMQGQNIFLVDAAALTDRVDAMPVVASANLEKQLPNQLTVTVVERTPVLLWQTKQGTYSVDKYGIVIAPAGETSGAASLRVVDARSERQIIHPGVQLNGADIAFAMEVFNRLPQMAGVTSFTLRYDPKISVDGGNGSYVVESTGGWVAYLGGAHDTNPLDNRLIELQQILAMAQQQQLSLASVDLRFGLRPVYTLKS